MGSHRERRVGKRSERWILRPLERPRLARYCAGCGLVRELVCSGKFRVNAQKKALDVWLNYRCEDCGGAWKAPVIERRPVSQMDPALLEAFERDDPSLVDRYAFDAMRWRAHILGVVAPPFTVERTEIECSCVERARLCIHIEARMQVDVRLDRLLSTELGLARTALGRLMGAGRLTIAPAHRDALRKGVRDGQRILVLDLADCAGTRGVD